MGRMREGRDEGWEGRSKRKEQERERMELLTVMTKEES